MRNLLTELGPSMHGNSHVFDELASDENPLNHGSTAAEVRGETSSCHEQHPSPSLLCHLESWRSSSGGSERPSHQPRNTHGD